MITEIFLNMVFALITGFLQFFPALVIPLDLFNALAGLIELLAIASYFMPIGLLQLAFIVWTSFYGIKFIIVCVNWVIGKIPTIT